MNKWACLVFLCLAVCNGFGQPKSKKDLSNLPFTLDTLKDMRVMIDGGCGFFGYDSLPSSGGRMQNVFIISAHKIAFFALKGEWDYVYLKRTSIARTGKAADNAYKEIFTGNGFTATLNSQPFDPEHPGYRKGILLIRNKKQAVSVAVRGMVDYQL